MRLALTAGSPYRHEDVSKHKGLRSLFRATFKLMRCNIIGEALNLVFQAEREHCLARAVSLTLIFDLCARASGTTR